MRHRGSAAAAVLAMLALAGCGSTVAVSSTERVGVSQDGNAGLGGSPTTGATTPTVVTGGSGSGGNTVGSGGSAAGGVVGGGSVTGGGSGSSASSPTSGGHSSVGSTSGHSTSSNSQGNSSSHAVAARIPTTGRGWDAHNIYIGVTTANDFNTAATALGLKSVNPGNQVKDAASMANELNSEGGIFGRKVVVAPYNVATTSMVTNPDSDAAGACTHFTQDRPVVAVFNTLTPLDTPTFRACFAEAKLPLFNGSVQPTDTAALAQLKGYVTSVVSPSFTNLAPVLVARLKAEGYFHGWNVEASKPGSAPVKVGVVAMNTPTGQRAASLLSSALARAGYAPAATFYYTVSAGGTANNLGSAILQFRSRGITHVMQVDSNFGAFMEDANGQKYYPRYGVSTFSLPMSVLTTNVPHRALIGTLGIGSNPALDVNFAQDPGYVNSAERKCFAVQRKGGQTYAGLRFAVAIGMEYCDTFNLIKAMAIAGGGLTGPDIVRGGGIAGPHFIPASGFRSGLSAGNYAVPGAARDLAWVLPCGCFKYTSSTEYSFGS